MSQEEPTTERWTFLGRRWDRSTNKITYLWRDGQGEERSFSNFKAEAVAGIYEVTIAERQEGGGLTVKAQPQWTGDLVEDEKVALHAADWDARRQKDAKARERRASQITELDDIADRLFEHVRDYKDVELFRNLLHSKLYERLERRTIERAKAAKK